MVDPTKKTLRAFVVRILDVWMNQDAVLRQPWSKLMLIVDIDLTNFGTVVLDNRTGITPTDGLGNPAAPRLPVWTI